MKPFLPLIAIVSALLGQTLAAGSQISSERSLITREVFLPKIGLWESSWTSPLFLAEPGNNRSSALFTNETLRGPGHLTGNPLAPSHLLTNSGRHASRGPDGFSIRAWGNSPGVPRCSLLASPNGLEFAAPDYLLAPDIKVWNIETGDFQRWLPYPDSPPGKPALAGFSYIQNAADINGDGWDDLFFQDWTHTSEGVAGCIDGKTGQALWMDFTDDLDTTSRVKPLQLGPPEDLNGDGIGDFVSAIQTYSLAQFGHRIIAHSGIDGSHLWQVDLSRSFIERFSISCPDLDGDQIDDIISLDGANFLTGNNGEITAISGATGAALWTRDCTFIQSMFPNAAWHAVFGQFLVTPSPIGNTLDLIIPGRIIYGTGGEETVFTYLDAKTGTPITSLAISDDLMPWHSHEVPIDLNSLIQAGDYDGDGFQEFATRVYLEGDDSNSTSIYPYALVILGQRTLFGPDKPNVGTSRDFDISLPAHPNAPYQLAFSTGFSPRTDRKMWSPQDWPTMLQWTGVAQKTSAMRSLRGNLDANGQTTISVNFPNNSNYIGIPFYARALIGDPTNPGEIVTQTSLHTLTLQP